MNIYGKSVSRKIIPVILAVLLALVLGAGINAQVSPAPVLSGPAITSISLLFKPPSEPAPQSPSVDSPQYFDVEVTIQTAGFNIVPKIDQVQPNVPGEGHVVYYDGAEPPINPGESALLSPGSAGVSVQSTHIPFTFLNEVPGYYTFAAQLVNNDGTTLNPPVYAMIKTNLEPVTNISSPEILAFSLGIAPPSQPAPTPAPPDPPAYFDVPVTLLAAGISIVPKVGLEAPNVAGEGHIIFYNNTAVPVDPSMPAVPSLEQGGAYARSTFIPFSFWNNVPGWHLFAAQLVNNDDTPLDPPVYAIIETNLPPGGLITATPVPTSSPAR